jgi:hypothetical protein
MLGLQCVKCRDRVRIGVEFVGNYTIVSYQWVCLLNFFVGVSVMSLLVLFVSGFDSVSKTLALILCYNGGYESVSVWLSH